MQVGDAIAPNLKPLLDGCAQCNVRAHVEEDSTCQAHEAPRPIGNDKRTNDTHERVRPPPAEVPTGKQPDDGEYRHCRVREHMDVGGAEVEIVSTAMGVVRASVIRI